MIDRRNGTPAHGGRGGVAPGSRSDAARPVAVKVLSGGNQQKSLLARWLMQHSDLLVLIEPTRGVDVGAKLEIYRELEEVAAAAPGSSSSRRTCRK